MSVKTKIFRILDDNTPLRTPVNRLAGSFLIVLILINVAAIILESFEELDARFHRWFQLLEVFSVFVFSVEYALRLWTADRKYPENSPFGARLRFFFSFDGLIDLVAVLPFYLPFFFRFDLRFIRILRVVRLLRIFKLNRYTSALRLVGETLREKRTELVLTTMVTLALLIISATIMYDLEHEVQPEAFPNVIATLWWAVATLTTVGYGDVYPITGWGRLVAGIIALLGIGLVALPTGVLSAAFIERLEKENRKEEPTENGGAFTYCPHCGKRLQG